MKRKRTGDMVAPYRIKTPYKKKRKIAIPRPLKGYARIGGFYGRFRGSMGESKFFDCSNTNYTFDSTGEVINLTATSPTSTTSTGTICQVVQGDTENNRNGRKIVITSIYMQGYIQSDSAFDKIQMCLILDTQCNGALPAYDDIFSAVPAATTERFLNVSNGSRFKVLKKIVMTFDATTALAGPVYTGTTRKIKFFKKCNIPIEYDNSATTGVITSIKSNNLFWVAISAQDDLSTLVFNNRIRFRDS